MNMYLLADTNNLIMYILIAVIFVAIVAWFVLSGRKNKQRQKEYFEQIDAIRPGNKIKSTGGICGIVVEVCDDETIILETGSEASGKSYVKLSKDAIYQTDAKGPTQIAREEMEAKRKAEKEGKSKGFPAEETPAEPTAPTEEPAPEPEAPVEEEK